MWPEVGDAGTSGAGAVPLRSAQMMGQQKQKTVVVGFFFFFLKSSVKPLLHRR